MRDPKNLLTDQYLHVVLNLEILQTFSPHMNFIKYFQNFLFLLIAICFEEFVEEFNFRIDIADDLLQLWAALGNLTH